MKDLRATTYAGLAKEEGKLLLSKISVKPILYAGAAFLLLPVAGVAAGAGVGYAGATYAGLSTWAAAGVMTLGCVSGFFLGQAAGIFTARAQIQKVVVGLAGHVGETLLTRLAKYLAKKTGVSADSVASPMMKDTLQAVTESLIETKPRSVRGLGAFFKRAASKVAVRQMSKPGAPKDKVKHVA